MSSSKKSKKSDKLKDDLAKIKQEIDKLLANESGRIDASKLKDKYKEYYSKPFNLPPNANERKIVQFLENHMSDTVQVTRGDNGNFIETKTKRKEVASTVKPQAKQYIAKSVYMVPQPPNDVLAGAAWPLPGEQTPVSSSSASRITPNPPSNVMGNVETEAACIIKQLSRKEVASTVKRKAKQNIAKSVSMPMVPQPPNDVLAGATWPLPGEQTPVSSLSASRITTNPPSNVKTMGNVKTEAACIIKELSKENYVNIDIVIKQLLEKFRVPNVPTLLRQYCRGCYKIEDIPTIKELTRKQREVNASIHAFVMVHSVSTLQDLSNFLTSLYTDARDFEDLQIGPLVKLPLVYQYFKFPVNQEPPDISTFKVMKYLRQFIQKNDLWRTKVELQEFLEYLTEQMSCSSPYELGVKISSVALMISAIKRCCSAESSTRKEAETKLKEEIADEVDQLVERNKRRLLGNNPTDPDALVNKLINLSPVEIITKLFEFCCNANFFNKKAQKKVEAFIATCNSDKMCRKLFQLALQKTCHDLVKPVEDNECYGSGLDGYIHDATVAEVTTEPEVPQPPTKDKLVKEVKRWLGKPSKSFDFKYLARIEEHVLSNFKEFKTFQELGYGTFLEFLSKEKELLALISLPNHTAEGALGILRTSDVVEVIKQCSLESDKTSIVNTIRAQYTPDNNVDSTTLDVLIEKARGNQGNQPSVPNVIFEACFACVSLAPPEVNTNKRSSDHVGSLGYQDMNTALYCLCHTPLLEDYAMWSNWDHVFAPMYGHLKDFLRNAKIPNEVVGACYLDDLVALETTTGSLLRVTRQTSLEVFLKSAKDGDIIGTSGHLVSLVLHHGGVEKAPLALLANRMKDALLSLTSQQSYVDADGYVVKFAIRCLQRIPDLMRLSLAKQIFIEPLQNVLGHSNAPGLILKHCETYEEKSMIYGLGVCLGITEWQEEFKTRFERVTLPQAETSNEEDHIKVIENDWKPLNTPSQDIPSENMEGNVEDTIKDENESHSDQPDGEVSLGSTESTVDVNEIEQHCRDVIESIRRDEFGIGIELPPEHRQMVENQRLREGRGLHRLSSELYSKDTHFVLELVQNADDNLYPEKSPDDPPSIAFLMNIEKIVVLNNEVGFEEKNIRALCDVGKSTKGKQRYGYIGQKGIGFKSVFRITDTPEVHSNGFHIKFDANSGPTGYILPHWCDDTVEDSGSDYANWTTRIVLSLRDEMKTVQKKTLIARFHDIQPSLLLFLRRLRQIKIVDEVSSTTREMCRRDLGDNLIELKHSNGADLWFVVKKGLPASNMKPDIETTEIALAFPLPKTNSDYRVSLDDVAKRIRGKSLTQQPVFAFLPLRSYGFRFIIQGDFDVPSSREDVDKDSAWNQWLREEISNLFVEAFDDFKNHACFSGVASIVQLLQFVPLEDEILDFFKPVTTTILDGIRRKKCIPVRLSSTNDSFPDIADERPNDQLAIEEHEANNETWVFPSQVVVAEDHLVEELISDKVLNLYLGKYYLHPDLQPFLNPPLCRVLGIETLSSRHLIDIGKAISSKVAVNLNGEQDKTFCSWVAKWLCAVHRCLERERDCSDETLQEIASLKLYPLSDGHFTALTGLDVFLPLEKEVKGEHVSTKKSKQAAEIVHKDLRTLHPMILSSLDDIGRPQVRKLLESLQVRCLTSRDLIKHHIIPSLKQVHQKQMQKAPDVICSYILYIKEQWDLDKEICCLEELRPWMLLYTNKGFVNPNVEPVHFTVEYGNKIDLRKDFPSVSWTLLDNLYISQAANTWETFFSELGVVHFLAVERQDVCLEKSQLSQSIWSSVVEFWKPSTGDGTYTVKDYASRELEQLLSSNSSEKELKKLIQNLDEMWDEKYAKYTKDVPYLDEKGNILGNTHSSFFINLKEKQWIPSRYGLRSPNIARRQAHDVFLATNEVAELLGDHAWYVDARLTNQKFLKALGIQADVNFDTMVEVFMKWVERSQDKENKNENIFETSFKHMSTVYEFMARKIQDSREQLKYLEDVVRNKNVVFVPVVDDSELPNDKIVTGRFVATKQVYWSDPSKMMSMTSSLTMNEPRVMLSNYYQHNLQYFFVNFLRIDENPNLSEYIGLMEEIAGESSIASEFFVDQMMYVYQVVGEKCLNDDQKSQFIKRKLTSLKVFATTDDKWVSLEDKPLFSDDKSLEKIFRDSKSRGQDEETGGEENSERMHFLKIGLQKVKKQRDRREMKKMEEEYNEIRKNVRLFFKEVCSIRNLSECVSQEIISTQTSPCYNLQLFLYRYVPHIQRFLYHKTPEHYDQQLETGIDKALGKLSCFETRNLEVVHRVSTHPRITKSVKKNCAIEKKDDILSVYVTDGSLADKNDCIKELSMFFAPPENMIEMNNFLSVLVQKQEDQIENFMEMQQLDSLPDDVQLWEIPEPKQIEIPVRQPVYSPETEDIAITGTGDESDRLVGSEDGEPRGLQSWPPRSSAVPPQVASGKNPATDQVLAMWPPPAPPEEYQAQETSNHVTVYQAPAQPSDVVKPVPVLQPLHEQHDMVEKSNGVFDNLVPNTDTLPPNVTARSLPVAPDNAQQKRTLPRILKLPDGEVPLEEVQLDSSIERPEMVSLVQSANAEEIGRWGEECVYLLLQKIEKGGRVVTWLNKEQELALPYDIIIKEQDIVVAFIEVKSTSSPEKSLLEISSQEVNCAFEKKESFYLYRVYSAGNPSDFRVSWLQNLAMNLDCKAVKLFIRI